MKEKPSGEPIPHSQPPTAQEPEMPSANTLGDRLRRLRLAAGLGQQELAERASIAAGTVSMVERGRASVDDRTIAALAQVLDVDPSYFVRQGLEPASFTPHDRHRVVQGRSV